MRRILVVLLVVLVGLPLVARAQSASPDSSLAFKPAVIVYPFAAGNAIDREASSRLATIIATEMANTKHVTVVPPPAGTERKDYLSVARHNNADYYVSGFISPLGSGVSVVEQVVSATNGIVVFSQSAQLQTYNDAAGQGDDLAVFIARHANRGYAAIGTPPPQPSPSAEPSSAQEANIGKLFSRRKKGASQKPTPAPSAQAVAATTVQNTPVGAVTNVTPPPAAPSPRPSPSSRPPASPAAGASASPSPAAETKTVARAAPQDRSYAVVDVGGTADAAARDAAVQRLVAKTNGTRVDSAATACANAHPTAILGGTLAVRPDAQFGGAGATFELIATDCAGRTIFRRTFSNDAGGTNAVQVATERAVDAAVGAYLNPPKRRRLL